MSVTCTRVYTLYMYYITAMLNIRVRDYYSYISCNSIEVNTFALGYTVS